MSLHLVTGGSGFVGSHTAEYLLDRGEDVRILDRVPPDVPGTDLVDRTEFVRGDVRERDRVATALEGVDYVHHNVALVPLTKAGTEFWAVNVEGTRNVMDLAAREGVDGITHVSSSAVYDISSMPVTESTPEVPIGRYGRSKLAADRVVRGFAQDGLPVNVLRPRTVLGERRAGIYQILFEWIDQDRRVPMLGDGTNPFQLVGARDLADASLRAAESDITGEVFNVGNEAYNTLGEDLRHLIDYADSSSSVLWVPAGPASRLLAALDRLRLSPLAAWHYETVHRPYYFDISKIKTQLGWEPTTGNFELFERTYDWYRANEVEATGAEGSVHRTAPKERVLGVLRRLA